MKNIIIDSSSAVLLYRSSVIKSLLKFCHPVIPSEVFSELTIPGYDGSGYFSELCASGEISVYKPDAETVNALTDSLHRGEREVIALFNEDIGEFIIIDDGKGSAFCRDNKIPYINALLTVKILFFSNLITETEYRKAWKWLLVNGRYSEKIKVWADYADKHILAAFM